MSSRPLSPTAREFLDAIARLIVRDLLTDEGGPLNKDEPREESPQEASSC